MKRLIMLIAYMSAAQWGCAQYVHWNQVYDEDLIQSWPQSVIYRDSIYYTFGYRTPTLFGRKSNMNGESVALANYDLGYAYALSHAGNINESVLPLDDDFIVIETPSNCGSDNSHFCMTKFNEDLDTLWSKRYNWLVPSDCDTLRSLGMLGEAVINDSVFVAVATLIVGSIAASDSLGLAYIHFDYDGNVLSYVEKQTTFLDDPPFPQLASGLRYIGNDELLQWGVAAPLLPGKLYDTQSQICVVKTDLYGEILDSLHFGDQNYNETYAALELVPGNKAILFYQYTLYDSGFPQWIKETEPRAVLIDLSDMSVIWEINLQTTFFDDYYGAIYRDALVTSEGKFVSCFTTGPMGLHLTGIMKIDSNGALEWCNEYLPSSDGSGQLVALVEAPDGGYVATGITGGNSQWLLKIDACGYEQPSGCPEVVGIEGDGRHPEPVEGSFPVWPNPFHTQLKAVLPPTATRVFISDATGRIVFEENIYYPRQEWNLSMLSDGVYVMSVELESGMMVSERIVKR